MDTDFSNWPWYLQFLSAVVGVGGAFSAGFWGNRVIKNGKSNGDNGKHTNGSTVSSKELLALMERQVAAQESSTVAVQGMSKGIIVLVEDMTRRQIREEEREKLERELR